MRSRSFGCTRRVARFAGHILRDNDKKFTEDFDEIFEDENMEVITIPYEAPDSPLKNA
jgi:hypothetical protein